MLCLMYRYCVQGLRSARPVAGTAKKQRVCARSRRGAYVDAFVGEARGNGGALFFGLAEQYRKLLDGGHGNVSPVVARQKGLLLC